MDQWRWSLISSPVFKGTLHGHGDDVMEAVSNAIECFRLKLIREIKVLHPSLDQSPTTQVWQVGLMFTGGSQPVWSDVQEAGDNKGGSCVKMLWKLHKSEVSSIGIAADLNGSPVIIDQDADYIHSVVEQVELPKW